MSQLSFDVVPVHDLEGFFARISECRNKNSFTHGLHPYPAKFIPHIPRVLLAKYAQPGALVLDPMCGSGTTLVEAALAGYRSVGVDLNPIATLVSSAKTLVPTSDWARDTRTLLKELAVLKDRLSDRAALRRSVSPEELPRFPRRQHWFQEDVTRELLLVQRLIGQLDSRPARTTALCALSAVLVSVSNQESETRWCAKDKSIRPGEVIDRVGARLYRNMRRVLEMDAETRAPANVCRGDARSLPLTDQSVDLVITSPPYANAHDYYLYNKLRMFWLGYDVSGVQRAEIGSRNKHSDLGEGINGYADAMRGVLSEIQRVLRERATAVVIVADAVIRGIAYDMGELYRGLAEDVGLIATDAFTFAHQQFNASFQRGFKRHLVKKTHVLVFRKGRRPTARRS